MNPAGIVLALALAAAGPAAALDADDIWQGWGEALARTGAVQAGSLHRDGPELTIRDFGARFDLPFGQIRWTVDSITMTEERDGSVHLTLPRAVPVTLALSVDLPWHRHRALTLAGEMTAEGLDWRYSGTPGDLHSQLSARRLTVEITDTEGQAAPDDLVAAFLVAEGVERTGHLRAGDSPRLGSETRIDRLLTDVSTRRGTSSWRRVTDYHDLATSYILRLPEAALNRASISQALRGGARLHAEGTAGRAQTRVIRTDGARRLHEAGQDLQDAGWALSLTRARGLDLMLSSGAAELAPDGQTYSRSESARLYLRLPLIARRTAQTAVLDLSLVGVVPPEDWADIGGEDAGPGRLDLALTGEMIVTNDLADGPPQGTRAAPFDLLRLDLETLDAAWGKTGLRGSGSLVWPEDDRPGAQEAAPEGEMTFIARGLHGALARASAAGQIPPVLLLSLRAALATFGHPIGPDRVEARVTVDAKGISVNGMPLPF